MTRLGILCAWLLLAVALHAGHTCAFTAGSPLVLEDRSGKATLDDVLRLRGGFRDVGARTPNYFFTSSAYWFRVPVHNQQNHSVALFMDVKHSTLDYVTLYVVAAGEVRDIVRSGDRMRARDRPYPAASLVLPFNLAAGQSAELYLRVQTEAGAMLVPFELLDERALAGSIGNERLLHGIILGLFGALFVFNFCIPVFLGDRTYIYYVVYLPLAYLTITSQDGFGPAVLYPGNTWAGNEGLVVFAAASYVLVLLFTRSFLTTAEHPVLDRWVKALIAVSALAMVSPFVLPLRICYEMALLMVFLMPLFGLTAGIVTWKRGKTEARFYVFGQAASGIGLLAFGLLITGILPYHAVLLAGASLGISADTLLLALAVADRMRLLQRAGRAAEARARQVLETQQDELTRAVASRTAELEHARRQAQLLATIDPLTGILNRRGLLERAQRDLKLAVRSHSPLSAIMFDIDYFKKVNDRYGHAEGDRVLRDVVSTARRAVRATDLFGRIGGEEFFLVMPGTAVATASQVAERIRLALQEEVFVGSPPVPVTASFGIACITDQDSSLDWLQSAADKALYKAKNNGRNRMEVAACELTYHLCDVPTLPAGPLMEKMGNGSNSSGGR